MPIRLEYRDRYRLWDDLVRGNADRLFVATDKRPALGDNAPIEIHLPELRLPIVVRGTVVGWRGKSERFDRGIYVRIAHNELDKCRRFLGLRSASEPERSPRQLGRVHCEIPIRLIMPDQTAECRTRNISDKGMLITCCMDLLVGQALKIEVLLEEGAEPLVLDAEVAWSAPSRELAGLQLVQLNSDVAGQLRNGIERLRKIHKPGDAETPRPILIADDDEMILQFLTKALSKHGYEVYPASNGEEAIQMVRHLHPELVVLDIVMPGMDGADVCKAIRADAELADIPVIFMSALEETSLHQVADESGATDYLAKPVSYTDVMNMIGQYLKA